MDITAPAPPATAPDGAPVDPEGSYELGSALTKEGKLDDAIEQFQSAYAAWTKANSPDAKLAVRGWGAVLRMRKDFKGAAEKFKEALDLAPNDEDSYAACTDLAQLLIEVNQFEEAVRLWSEAVAIGQRHDAAERRIALRGWSAALGEAQRGPRPDAQ